MAIGLLAAACGDRKPMVVTLEPTPVLSGGLGWAVVGVAYGRLLGEAAGEASVTGYVRKGQVFSVASRLRKLDKGRATIWYELRDEQGLAGWMPESQLTLYSSREQAENSPYARERAEARP